MRQVPSQIGIRSRFKNSLIMGVSLLVTLLTISLPWQLRYRFAFFLAKSSFWLMGHSDRFYRKALEAKFVGLEEANLTKSKKENDFVSSQVEGKNEIALFFSGGSDSTLAAIRLSSQFDKVHLLTFDHDAIPDQGRRSFTMDNKLRERFGEERFTHTIINVQDIMNKVYRKRHLHDLRRYGLFEVNLCAACKLSMYLAMMKYCLEKNLKFAASGANKDAGDIISDQMPQVSELLEGFFKRHGITYMTPVYDVDRSDWELFELGLTDKRDLKARATRSANSAQAYCENSFPYIFYAKGYHVLRYGQKSLERTSIEWYKEKIAEYEPRISDVVLLPGNEPYRMIARLENKLRSPK